MNEELLKIAQYQIPKLPESVRKVFLSDETTASLSEIKAGLGLSEEQGASLNTEILFLLLGTSSPKELPQTLKEDLGLNEMLLKTLLRELDEKILEPIYPDLVRFYEQEEVERAKNDAVEKPAEGTPAAEEPKARQWEKVPSVAPDNLPTGQDSDIEALGGSFMPQLTPKTPPEAAPGVVPEPPHPFEEKMQKVFTAGTPGMENLDLANEAAEEPKPAVTISRPAAHDPYREPIE